MTALLPGREARRLERRERAEDEGVVVIILPV